MYERLIYLSKKDMESTRQLLLTNFPLIKIWDVNDPDVPYVMDIELSIDTSVFFRWAIRKIGMHDPVILRCLNLSLELCDPPPWMLTILRESNPKMLNENNF
jgi:hypothetical protein